jgi:hypothetical protein
VHAGKTERSKVAGSVEIKTCKRTDLLKHDVRDVKEIQFLLCK